MNAFIGPNLRLILKLVLFLFTVQFLYRLGFAYWFSPTANDFSAIEFQKALYLGAKFDLRMSLIYSLPFALFIYFSPAKSAKLKTFWLKFYTFVLFVINACYFLDFAYYAYLNTRINGTAVRFLINPATSAKMVWQSYPIVWNTSAALALTLVMYLVLRFWTLKPTKPFVFAPSFTKYISFSIGVLIFFVGIYGKFSHYPLRWSEAFFSKNTFISALALNPIHYFADTFSAKEQSFDRSKVTKHYEAVSRFLDVKDVDLEKLNFKRTQIATPLWGDQKPNVVVIVLESFGAYKTGVMKHPLNPTPYFDELMHNGHLFSRFFVPSEGTARSMFSLVSGVPDVTSYRTSSRNPLITKQNSAANALTDYTKLYFIGGSANWGEIRGVISSSIAGVKIFEEGMFELPRTDVWGLSDLDLFKEAHKQFKKQDAKKPFFALLQSAGFHRPYTIPDARDDFEIKTLDEKELSKYGFISNAEYNSIRFEDYSLGQLIKLAKTEAYFDNTIFVVLGDHGLPSKNAQHIPKGYLKHKLARFHVPLLFYGPKFFEPAVDDKISTEPDVLATVAAITGHEYTNKAIGRNLFNDGLDRKALMFVYHTHPKEISIIDDKYFAVGNVETGITQLFEWGSDNFNVDIKNEHPEIFQELKNLGEGLYETSRYMLYNNTLEPEKIDSPEATEGSTLDSTNKSVKDL